MKIFSRHLLALILGIASQQALSADIALLSSFEVASNPAQSPIWQRLLHIEQKERGQSMVRDSDFFLAANGHSDPSAELQANLRAFWSDSTEKRLSRCRFPARYLWLSQVYGYQDSEGLSRCKEYLKWRDQMPDGKLTLIFPSYQLNSPSSMFGHTLLRVDPVDTEYHATWLSQAVNFGATGTEQDNSATYALKGISGGYTGGFAVMPYFHKIQEYGHDENRDIWEYPLDFSPEETEWLVTHLWELRGIEFGYYFFDQNCSYRLLELLEVARPTLNLTTPFELTAIPVDTIRELDKQQLVIGQVFRPSQERQLHDLLARVDSGLHPWMLKLREDPTLAKTAEFKALPEDSRAKLLQVAYGYTRFKDRDGDRVSAANRIHLLREIKNLSESARQNLQQPGSKPSSPESGHYSRRVELSYNQQEDVDNWLLSTRMAFHSLDDNAPGYLAGAQINMMDLQLRHTAGKLKLEKLDRIDIASLVPSKPYFPHIAWKVLLGIAPFALEDQNKTGLQLSGGVGYSRALGDRLALYGLLQARSEFNHRNGDFYASLGPQVGLLVQQGNFTLHLEGEKNFFDQREIDQSGIKINYRLSQNTSIAFKAERASTQLADSIDSSTLSFRYFFR